jgi:hypothetical protein
MIAGSVSCNHLHSTVGLRCHNDAERHLSEDTYRVLSQARLAIPAQAVFQHSGVIVLHTLKALLPSTWSMWRFT